MQSFLAFLQIIETLWRWLWNPVRISWMIIVFNVIERLDGNMVRGPGLWEFLATSYLAIRYYTRSRYQKEKLDLNIAIDNQNTVKVLEINAKKEQPVGSPMGKR